MNGVVTLRLGVPAVAGATAPHAYWRIFSATNHGGSGVVLTEVEFRATVGGSDQSAGGTAIGSDDVVSNEKAKAFDNNTGTSWFADIAGTNQWIGYHFASPVSVAEVALMPGTGGTDPIGRCPYSCTLDYSDDGATWFTAQTFTFAWPCAGENRIFPEAAAASGYHRAWRILVTATNSTSTVLTEMEMRATAGGADQTFATGNLTGNSSGRPFSNFNAATAQSWLAFDGGSGNWFVSGVTNGPYLGFVFNPPVKVEEITQTAPASNFSRMPKNFTFEWSDDEINWTVQKTFINILYSANETKTLAAI